MTLISVQTGLIPERSTTEGLTLQTPWLATFISAPAPTGTDTPAPYFRRNFEARPDLTQATLSVTALGIVEPYLNGTRVGDEVLAPGWTSYTHRLNVSTFDVTDLITEGANALGAIVGEGWASGRLGWEGQRALYSDRPALFMQLELRYGVETEIIGTDGKFSIGSGAVLRHSIYDGEDYDARLEPRGWSTPQFDATDWDKAVSFDWNLDTLTEPVGPPVRRVEELAPINFDRRPSGRTIVDFGQNISGWVRLSLAGEAGQTITLRHAEVLTPEGELDRETNRTAEATDRYTFSGDGLELWEPRFTFHGFRYVEVEGWADVLDADAIRGVVVHTDMRRAGWFETSDPLVTKLHDNVVWSMRDNFVSVPTDCPQRDERLGWTGDINAFGPTAAFLYDVRGMLGSWLQDLASEQAEKGYVPWVVPNTLANESSPTALWGDVAVSLPWTLYQEYGDLDILRESYDSMAAFTRQVEGLLDDDGLWSSGFQFGDWLDPDAPAANPAASKTDRHLVATAYLARTAREMTSSAQLLGKEEDAVHFGALAGRVRAAFRREYVTPSGRLTSESATAYALAIELDLLDADQRRKAGERLERLVREHSHKISTGFAGTPLVVHALSNTGHLATAYKLLLEKECPSFLYPVTMGATTIWERWDSILPDGTLNSTGMTSLNHYALGAVASWLHQTVGGLQRLEPAYRRVRIAPKPGGGLTWAHVAHETPHGLIDVSWRIDDHVISLGLKVPEGVEAVVALPLHPDATELEVTAGTHSWRYDIDAAYGGEPIYGLDSPMKRLATVPSIWSGVVLALQKHLPVAPVEPLHPGLENLTLRTLTEYLPGAHAELEKDLLAALEASPTH